MALRLGWKEGLFVISVGGFHPDFNEVPAGLTDLKRVSIALLSGNNPRLTAKMYFAITANTVQTGAGVELYADGGTVFSVSGHVGYDVLIQMNPFKLKAEIGARMALKQGSETLMSVRVEGTLTGPAPWHVEGEASFTVCWQDITLDFRETWGDEAPSVPVEIADVLGLMVEALHDDRNWKTDLPANTNLTVSLRKMELAANQIVVHPFGVLSTSQKVAPLNMDIDRFGFMKPVNDTRFNIEYAGGISEEVREEFAVSNFKTLSDSQKLSRKSFEKLPSGVKLKADDSSQSGNQMQKEVTYELSYMHEKELIGAGLRSMGEIFALGVAGSSAAFSSYAANARCNGPAGVAVTRAGYSVVNVRDMSRLGEEFRASSEAEAYEMCAELERNDSSLAGEIQVVSDFEL
jgi:hypothetical protein